MLMIRSPVARDHAVGHQLEVAGQHQQIHRVAIQLGSIHSAAAAGSRSTTAGIPRRGARFSAGGLGPVAQDQDDSRRRIRTERTKQRLEVAAASRDGHGHVHWHGGRS